MRAVLHQGAALLVVGVLAELRDPEHPELPMPGAPGVLVDPRPRRLALGELPAFLDDQERPAGPVAGLGELAADVQRPGLVDRVLDVVDDRQDQRRDQPVGGARDVEQRQRRVGCDGRLEVGDVRERTALDVGRETRDQRVDRRCDVAVVAGGVGEPLELLDEQRLAGPLGGDGAAGVHGGDRRRQGAFLVGAEAALFACGVADQQRVEGEQELELGAGDGCRVGDVPGADDVAAAGSDVDLRRAGYEAQEGVVVALDALAAIAAADRRAVDDEAAHALRNGGLQAAC